MNYKTTKGLIEISMILFIAFILFTPKTVFAYNKSWDQGHQCTEPNPGSDNWGRYDYNGVFRGGYVSKECCEILCKICPVYANTGQLQKTFMDLTVPGISHTLTITRTYNSQDWATSLHLLVWIGKRI